MSLIEQSNTSSDAVIQTVRWARKQGFRSVPLRPASKAAFDEKYVDLNYTPPPDDFWTARNLGVGVVCGPKYGPGPIDVDVDCEEALFFAKLFLPPSSAVFGRKSKRASHWIYRVSVDEFPKRAFVDPVAKSTIIELRGDGGHQTVFPGSKHEATGETIEWEEVPFPDVPTVDAALLEFAVKKIAIATLVVRHMWADGQRNEVCKHLTGLLYYIDWNEEEVKSLIQAVMDFTGDDDKTRVKTVHSTFKKGEKGGKITGSNALRALLADAKAVDAVLEWGGSSAATLLSDYNERFAIVSLKGKFRIAETMGMEKGGPPTLFAREDFINFMETDTITIDNKRASKAKMWLANPRRRAYRGLDFVPGVEDTSPILNLWTGWATEPKPEHSCRAWLDLLYYTVCGSDDATFSWVLHWFANILREPLNKPLTAPVLIGRQGAGKSLLIGYFGRILGPAYTTITNDEHIYGKFNKHLATTLLLHSEEALYGGDRKHRGIIKSLITDEYRIFEQKGVDAEKVKNYLRLILSSNEAWAAPTEVDDRRFTILDLEGRSIEPAVTKEVLKEMSEGGPSALMHYLMHDMEYDDMLARKNIKNDALANLKKINLDPVSSWWYECLKIGKMLPDYLEWASKPPGEEWPEVVASGALYTAMSLSLRASRQRYIPDITAFGSTLNKMVGSKLERLQKYFNNPASADHPREVRMLSRKQYTIVNMPTLENCRRAFNWFIGQDITWPHNEPREVVVDKTREKHDEF